MGFPRSQTILTKKQAQPPAFGRPPDFIAGTNFFFNKSRDFQVKKPGPVGKRMVTPK
jgi:hypothetical protein